MPQIVGNFVFCSSIHGNKLKINAPLSVVKQLTFGSIVTSLETSLSTRKANTTHWWTDIFFLILKVYLVKLEWMLSCEQKVYIMKTFIVAVISIHVPLYLQLFRLVQTENDSLFHVIPTRTQPFGSSPDELAKTVNPTHERYSITFRERRYIALWPDMRPKASRD